MTGLSTEEPAPPESQDPMPEEEAGLWRALAASPSATARERLFSFYAGFARGIARRHHRERSWGDIELEELDQLAFAGLLEALDRFDPQRGAPFRPFAVHRIAGSIRDGIARMSEMREQISWHHRMRRERLKSLTGETGEEGEPASPIEKLAGIAVSLALGFMLEGTGLVADGEVVTPTVTAYDSLAWKETVTQLHAEVSSLPDREQTILRQHYLNGVNFEQIASLLGITKGRVSQLHYAALQILRKRMRDRGHFRIVR